MSEMPSNKSNTASPHGREGLWGKKTLEPGSLAAWLAPFRSLPLTIETASSMCPQMFANAVDHVISTLGLVVEGSGGRRAGPTHLFIFFFNTKLTGTALLASACLGVHSFLVRF